MFFIYMYKTLKQMSLKCDCRYKIYKNSKIYLKIVAKKLFGDI